MNNCFDCKYKQVVFTDSNEEEIMTAQINKFRSQGMEEINEVLFGHLMFGKCLIGHTRVFIEFYKQRGKLPKTESETLKLSCYEPTEGMKKIDDLISQIDNMLDKRDNAKSDIQKNQ
jgi:hypothetical protein